MKIKAMIAFVLAIILIAFMYLGIIKKGFFYFTGISTPYSYFQARIVSKDSILTFIEPVLDQPMVHINIDSLQHIYGFTSKFGGYEVSNSVIKLYNSVILDELMQKLGEKKWNEYLWKVDSLESIAMKRIYGIDYHPKKSSQTKKNRFLLPQSFMPMRLGLTVPTENK